MRLRKEVGGGYCARQAVNYIYPLNDSCRSYYDSEGDWGIVGGMGQLGERKAAERIG